MSKEHAIHGVIDALALREDNVDLRAKLAAAEARVKELEGYLPVARLGVAKRLKAAEAERDRLREIGNKLWVSSDDDTAKAAWLRALARVEPAREEEGK